MPGPQNSREAIPVDEVEAVLAKRVAEEVAKQVALIKESLATAGATGDAPWMQALALQIATLADQGTGRKRISPEEMTKREKARERMTQLIIDARVAKKIPTYKLRSTVYLGERKIQPIWIDHEHHQQPTEIGWYDVPNEAMEPLNDEAKGIYTAFAESIGAVKPRAVGKIKVSAGGLTIMQGPQFVESPQATPGELPPEQVAPIIRGRGAPLPLMETHILGTLMPPARQQP